MITKIAALLDQLYAWRREKELYRRGRCRALSQCRIDRAIGGKVVVLFRDLPQLKYLIVNVYAASYDPKDGYALNPSVEAWCLETLGYVPQVRYLRDHYIHPPVGPGWIMTIDSEDDLMLFKMRWC